MNRSSKYFALKYFVEVKPVGSHAYETIAAFDVESIAKNYCDDCAQGKPFGFIYRVLKRGSSDPTYLTGRYGGRR